MADMAPPILSVVIPTLGRPFVVRTLLSLVSASGFERLEVLLVGKLPDLAVAEEVRRLIERYPHIKHIPVVFERGDSSEKKNTGARSARAEIVAFLDDDVIVAPDWPDKILESFSDPDVGLVSGPSLVPGGISLTARLAGMALSSPAAGYVAYRYLSQAEAPRPVKWSKIIGCNMAYRKSVLLEIGGFDPRFWPGEEMLASHQVAQRKHRIIFHPKAWVEHYPRTSVAGFIRQMYGYGATRIRLIRAGVESELTPLLPGVCLLALLILLPLAWAFHWAAVVLLAGVGLYVVSTATIAAMKVLTTRCAVDALLVAYIPLMHLSYGWGEWCELLRPGRDLSEKRISNRKTCSGRQPF